jgi:hypothetical protein
MSRGVTNFGTASGSRVPPGMAARARRVVLPWVAAYNESTPAPLNFRKSLLEIMVSSKAVGIFSIPAVTSKK